MRPKTGPAEEERSGRGGQGFEFAPGVTVGSSICFRAAVDWTDPRTPEAASAAPIGKPENPENTVLLL